MIIIIKNQNDKRLDNLNTSLTTLYDGQIDEITEHVAGKIARIGGSKARRLCWTGVSHEMGGNTAPREKSQVSTARDQILWRNGFERKR